MEGLLRFSLVSVLLGLSASQSCTPSATPFSWTNRNSWPLNNASVPDATGITEGQAETTSTALAGSVSDYTLRKHNCLRASVPRDGQSPRNMLRMEWNAIAQSQAQAWANNCQYQHNTAAQRNNSQFLCGQNLAASSSLTSWNRMINMWYNEINSYTYGNFSGSPTPVVGHYTQMVWASSFQLGCAYKKCLVNNPFGGTSPWYYYVCHYCAQGNMVGAAPYKRGPWCADCGGTTSASCVGGRLCTNSCAFSNVYSNCESLKASCGVEPVKSGCKATCNCAGKIY